MNLGNFAFYKGQFVILIAEQDTLMGTVWTAMNLNTKAITLVNEQDLTAYSRKPRGVKPASDMTDRQQNAITFIRQLTGAYFNGRSLSDVSTFIGLFLNRAKDNARQKAYDDYVIGDAMIETSITTSLPHHLSLTKASS